MGLERFSLLPRSHMSFPGGSDGKESSCNAEDLGSTPGLGRFPGEGNGYPLQNSGLENSIDRGAWQATVHGSQSDRHDRATSTFKVTHSLRSQLNWVRNQVQVQTRALGPYAVIDAYSRTNLGALQAVLNRWQLPTEVYLEGLECYVQSTTLDVARLMFCQEEDID